jgi:hypothetical protein
MINAQYSIRQLSSFCKSKRNGFEAPNSQIERDKRKKHFRPIRLTQTVKHNQPNEENDR